MSADDINEASREADGLPRDPVFFDFATLYREAPAAALDCLRLLLLDEEMCRARLAFLRGLAASKGPAPERRKEAIRIIGEEDLQTLEDAGKLREHVETINAILCNPDWLWQAHEAFCAPPTQPETRPAPHVVVVRQSTWATHLAWAIAVGILLCAIGYQYFAVPHPRDVQVASTAVSSSLRLNPREGVRGLRSAAATVQTGDTLESEIRVVTPKKFGWVGFITPLELARLDALKRGEPSTLTFKWSHKLGDPEGADYLFVLVSDHDLTGPLTRDDWLTADDRKELQTLGEKDDIDGARRVLEKALENIGWRKDSHDLKLEMIRHERKPGT